LWALAGCALLAGLFFWPAVAHLGSTFLGSGVDAPFYLWVHWWVPHALTKLKDPFATGYIFYPVGAELAFGANLWPEAAVNGLISRFAGFTAAVNLSQLAGVILSGLGAYLLALHECRDRGAAFVAGAGFMLAPYHFVQLEEGQYNLAQTEFLPFGILAFILLIERPTRGRAAAFGLVAGLQFLTELNYAIFLALACAVVAACRPEGVRRRAFVVKLLGAGVVACTVALPLLLAMARAIASHQLDPIAGWGSAQAYSSDLLAPILPPWNQPLWGRWLFHLRPSDRALWYEPWLEGYPGLILLAAAVPEAIRAVRARSTLWPAMAGTFAILSLGPVLRVAGRTPALRAPGFHRALEMPLPYVLIHFVPLLNEVRVPARFEVVAILAIDVLAAITIARVAARARPLAGWLLPAGVLLVTLIELLPGRAYLLSARVPAPYTAIARDPAAAAVLEVPLQWHEAFRVVGDTSPYRYDAIFLYYATVHGKPLVGGVASRYPKARFDALSSIPVYRQLLDLQGEPGYSDPPAFTAADLKRLGIGFVVYHRDLPEQRAFDYLSALGLPVLADDGTVIVWKVP